MPPSTENTEQMLAYHNPLEGIERVKAMSNTSGGIGKNEDSVKARMASAGTA
jgi:hypothetical protein